MASSEAGVTKNGDKNAAFRPINRYISETIKDRYIVIVVAFLLFLFFYQLYGE